MKRKIIIYIAIALIVYIVAFVLAKKVFAIEAIQPFQPTYFITGDGKNQTKIQVSFKYVLYFPYTEGLTLGYTQVNHWNLYDRSSPFKSTDYNPSIFYEKENPFEFFDFIRLAFWDHKSNGKDGQESRSVDRGYIESQLSYGMKYEIGIREKITCFYSISNKNKDIKRYQGYFETEAYFQIKSKQGYFGHERISMRGEWTHKYYWMTAELSFRIFTTKFRPHVYVQWYNGYNEFLIDYNKKTNALRAGLIFNPE